jgi:zinc and cadmium transporter
LVFESAHALRIRSTVNDSGGHATSLILLAAYCTLILLASLAGGWLPLLVRLTHTRIQVATSFVAGLMLGVALLHLAPHAWEQLRSADSTMGWLLAGFLSMFFVQRYLHFHHHDVPEEAPETHLHEGGMTSECIATAAADREQTLADKSARHLSWVGAAAGLTLHTLLDGVALAASVELDRHAGHTRGLLGLGTFLVIFLHKPFDALAVGMLLAVSGAPKALRHWINGFFALANPVGILLFYLGAERFSQTAPHLLGAVLAFTAGTFLSIATSDLLPELQFHAHDRGKLSLALIAGIAVSALIGGFEMTGHGHDIETVPPNIRQHEKTTEQPL